MSQFEQKLHQLREKLAAYWEVSISEIGDTARKHLHIFPEADIDLLCRYYGIHPYTFDLIPIKEPLEKIAESLAISLRDAVLRLQQTKHMVRLAVFRERNIVPPLKRDWTLDQLLMLSDGARRCRASVRTRLRNALTNEFTQRTGIRTDMVPILWLVEQTIPSLREVPGIGSKSAKALSFLLHSSKLDLATDPRSDVSGTAIILFPSS